MRKFKHDQHSVESLDVHLNIYQKIYITCDIWLKTFQIVLIELLRTQYFVFSGDPAECFSSIQGFCLIGFFF